jgi:hypothetical protein
MPQQRHECNEGQYRQVIRKFRGLLVILNHLALQTKIKKKPLTGKKAGVRLPFLTQTNNHIRQEKRV